jgi:hypothetical protein
MSRPTAYLFGSGPSLLDLTAEEKHFLNEQPQTLSLNQYLLHWQKVGVVPQNHLLADTQFPCIKIFVDTQRVIRDIGKPVTFYMNRSYLRYFPNRLHLGAWKHAIRKRWEVWRDFKYRVPLRIRRDNLVPFSQVAEERYRHLLDANEWYWARSLEDPLYFFRGTLTSAINLAAIVWPESDIKLLGVDLNSYGYFFDPDHTLADAQADLEKNKRRVGEVSALHHQKSHQLNIHSTAVQYDVDEKKSLPGIQSVFPRIREELARNGRRLFCCNPKSLLVTDGVCPFAPVME